MTRYSEPEFRALFRMSKRTATCFIEQVGELLNTTNIKFLSPREHSGGTEEIWLKNSALIFLWYMATSCTYRQLATVFGVSESRACVKIHAFIKLLNEHMLKRFISWPCPEDMQEIANMYEDLKGFRGIVGIIDGCHIPIIQPIERGADYYNRKDLYSIILQGVVREDLRFTNVYRGWPGKVHDVRVFAASPLATKGQALCQDKHLLGDRPYPCVNWLLTPIKKCGGRHLTANEFRFNKTLPSMRVTVKRAFGLLKGRSTRLRPLHQHDVQLMSETVLVACILHNICIMSADEVKEALHTEGSDLDIENQENMDNLNGLYDEKQRARGNLKRLAIIRELSQ